MILEDYLSSHPKKHLIFDLDLTLVELVLPWEVIIKRTEDYFGSLDPVLAGECRNFGYGGYNLMIKKYGKIVKKRIDAMYLQFETKLLREIIPNKDLVRFIKDNKNKYSFYLLSNNQRPTVDRAITELNLKDSFVKTVSASDVSFYKPDPEGFNLIYNPSVTKSNYLIIGDGPPDKKLAANVGIDYFYLHI